MDDGGEAASFARFNVVESGEYVIDPRLLK
jgi:hypothetical protein